MDSNEIVVKGARENNLKDIDVTIPKNALVVFTGVSGSGKSTLAFDTIFAEGQRRYIESLSSYARQFLGSYEKPDVDSIDGLTPTISIDQKTKSHNPRSTVGTVTEIYDYLRLLFGRIGEAYCPHHHIKIEALTADQITGLIMNNPNGARITIFAPLARNEKGTHYEDMDKFFRAGFSRMRIDGGDEVRYPAVPLLDKNKKHNIDIVVDRIILKAEAKERINEGVKAALDISNGFVNVDVNGTMNLYSEHHSCPICGFSVPKIEPRLFSFNNPLGCCPDCKGLGVKINADPALLVSDPDLSIKEGAIRFYTVNKQEANTIDTSDMSAVCAAYKIPLDVPFRELSAEQKDIIFNGPKEPVHYTYRSTNGSLLKKTVTEGLLAKIDRLYSETKSEMMKDYYSLFMSTSLCPTCHGARLNEQVLAIKVGEKNIFELCQMPLNKLLAWFNGLKLTPAQQTISELVIKEIKARLGFLCDVGLDYLTLSREAMTLSGGESQRIRLATQIGSKLSGIIYVLDEPSIGLHQRDNDKLISTMKEMRDLGNTLIVVEHDEDTMRAADWLVDIGPGAGEHGGEVVYSGKPEGILNCSNSITGDYLSGRKFIPVPAFRRPGIHDLVIKGARCHNLKNIDVTFKTGALNLVTGVSGSGKSSLVTETLYKSMLNHLNIGKENPGECDSILGLKYFDKVINVSQDPIGKTPRSNPATYVKVFDDIRDLFASTKEARLKGFDKSSFSFNTKGGRCEACQGDGVVRISMSFLPDVYVTCPVCQGKRYTDEILQVTYKGKNIYDVLNMRAEDAYEFFKNIPSIERKLRTLLDVGLGYIKLGQTSPTLSGGESQRVKLAFELEKVATSNTLYILDEPTTGLHTDDIAKLVNVLNQFVDAGNTVIVIEHNLDFVKCADWVVDLGPEGGDEGGKLLIEGTPEQVAACPQSYTGQYLKKYLVRK
jgi:excinuclease ABC subunit A